MAIEPPKQNIPSETAHTSENLWLLPVISRIACASLISLRKMLGFFLPDDSLISSRMFRFGLSKNANTLSVNSTGFNFRIKNAPTISPAHANSCIAVTMLHLPFP